MGEFFVKSPMLEFIKNENEAVSEAQMSNFALDGEATKEEEEEEEEKKQYNEHRNSYPSQSQNMKLTQEQLHQLNLYNQLNGIGKHPLQPQEYYNQFSQFNQFPQRNPMNQVPPRKLNSKQIQNRKQFYGEYELKKSSGEKQGKQNDNYYEERIKSAVNQNKDSFCECIKCKQCAAKNQIEIEDQLRKKARHGDKIGLLKEIEKARQNEEIESEKYWDGDGELQYQDRNYPIQQYPHQYPYQHDNYYSYPNANNNNADVNEGFCPREQREPDFSKPSQLYNTNINNKAHQERRENRGSRGRKMNVCKERVEYNESFPHPSDPQFQIPTPLYSSQFNSNLDDFTLHNHQIHQFPQHQHQIPLRKNGVKPKDYYTQLNTQSNVNDYQHIVYSSIDVLHKNITTQVNLASFFYYLFF